jgi:hypothetical protein
MDPVSVVLPSFGAIPVPSVEKPCVAVHIFEKSMYSSDLLPMMLGCREPLLFLIKPSSINSRAAA